MPIESTTRMHVECFSIAREMLKMTQLREEEGREDLKKRKINNSYNKAQKDSFTLFYSAVLLFHTKQVFTPDS